MEEPTVNSNIRNLTINITIEGDRYSTLNPDGTDNVSEWAHRLMSHICDLRMAEVIIRMDHSVTIF